MNENPTRIDRDAGATPCRDPEFLQRFLGEQLDEAEEARVQEHVGACPDCQRALESAAGDADLWQSLRRSLPDGLPTDAPSTPDQLRRELADSLAPSDDPEMLGRLGAYEVKGVIGSGSTGIVLKALEPRLNRYVAIKLMAPSYRSSGAARRRFEREGRAVAAVSHDHVVPIHSVDEFRGLPYIVMKYVPGPSLQQRLDRDGPLDSCEVARVGLQVASALAAAHAQGIVHRDVKPANVILEETVDRAMVTDFGLARVVDEVSLTHSGTITGTPQYMSPEQARGDALDARSDLFSLGSLLYAACTAQPPFRAQTLFGVIHRVAESQPRPVRELNPAIDPWIAALIDKLMSKRPADRFPSAAAVATALEAELAYLQNPTAVARPARSWCTDETARTRPSRWSRRAWVGGGAIAAAGAIAIAGWMWGLDGDAPSDGATTRASFLAAGGGGEVRDLRAGRRGAASHELTRELSYAIAAGSTFRLHAEVGDVVVAAAAPDSEQVRLVRRFVAEDEAAARQLVDRHELRYASENDRASLHTTLPTGALADGESRRSITHELDVPPGVQVEIETGNGTVRVGALASDLRVEATGGDVICARIDGDVWIRSRDAGIELADGCTGAADLLAIGGHVRVANVTTSARVRTSNGDVWLGESAGEVYAQTSGGSVVVDGVVGPTGGFASGGDVVVRVPRTPTANCRFNAADGNVRLTIARGVVADVAARGRVDTTFAVETVDADDGTGNPWSVTRLNGGGGTRIRVSSASGTVTIRPFETAAVAGGRAPKGPRQGVGATLGGPDGTGPTRGGPAAAGPIASGPSGQGPSGTGPTTGRGAGPAGAPTRGRASVSSSGGSGGGAASSLGRSGSGSTSASSLGRSGSGSGSTSASSSGGSGSGSTSASSLSGSGSGSASASSLGGSGSESTSASSLGGSGSGSASASSLGGSGSGSTSASSLGGSGSGSASASSLGGGGRGSTSASSLGGSGRGGASVASTSGPGRASSSNIERTTVVEAPRPGAFVAVELPQTDADGEMDGYTLYLPRSHDTREELFPVLVYLQGAYGVGGEIADLNNWGLARLVRDETDLTTERNRLLLDGFIVVCPHIEEGNYHDHPDVVRGILDHVFTTCRADSSRVYLTGLSRGGHGTWGLASLLPTTFAAIAPIGGRATGITDWSSFGDTAIWVSHNRGDGVVPFAAAAEAIDRVEREFDVRFRRFDRLVVTGTDVLEHRYVLTSARTDSHDAWTDVYSRPEFYRWLLRQRRAPAPKIR